jgi:PAT family beta-lactamase induction signal transducer AmpG
VFAVGRSQGAFAELIAFHHPSMPSIPVRTWPALLLLGFASGLPYALVDSTLMAWLAKAGWTKEELVWAGYVSLPYLFKVVWAPVVDRCVLPWFGRRRGWLLATQLAVMVGLGIMSFCDPMHHPGWLLVAATIAAFASATQDLAVNGYTIDAVPAEKLATGAGLSVWGYRAAMVVSGGLALVAADKWGWSAAYLVMAMLLIPGLIGTLIAPEPMHIHAPTTWEVAILEPLNDFNRRLGDTGLLLLLVLVLCYRLTDGLANMMTSPFLIAMKYDLTELGLTRSWVGLIGAALGSGMAAWCCFRLGMMSALWIFGILQALSNLGYVGIEQGWWTGTSGLIGVLLVDTACGAAAGTAFVGWIMGFCSPTFSATQFALLTAVTVLGPHLLRPVIAARIEMVGWSGYFVLTTLVMIPGLLLLLAAKNLPRRSSNDLTQEQS